MNEPAVLTANTFFWRGASSASARRSNERRHQAAVASWLRQLGFGVTCEGDYVCGAREFAGAEVAVEFYYRESCTRAYKRLSVRRGGKTSNITLLRKIAQQVEACKPQ